MWNVKYGVKNEEYGFYNMEWGIQDIKYKIFILGMGNFDLYIKDIFGLRHFIFKIWKLYIYIFFVIKKYLKIKCNYIRFFIKK